MESSGYKAITISTIVDMRINVVSFVGAIKP